LLAAIANIASVINVLVPDIPLEIQAIWTTVVILLALMISLIMLVRRSDLAYSLVIVWGCSGIDIKQESFPIIHGAALLSASALVVTIVVQLLLRKRL